MSLVTFGRRIEALNERKYKTLIEISTESQVGVDKGLVALFLRMSPEERASHGKLSGEVSYKDQDTNQ